MHPGPGGHAHGSGHALRLRVGRAVGAQIRPASHGYGWSRRPQLVGLRRGERRGLDHGVGLHRRRRQRRVLRAHLVSLPRGDSSAGQRGLRHRGHRGLVAGMGIVFHRHGGVARPGGALAHHVEGPHLRPDRGDRGGGDDVVAGDLRRWSQLGLPLLLVARRHPNPGSAHALRLPRRGHGVAGLAAALGCRRSRRPADHVRAQRRATAGGVGGALAVRL